MVLLAGRLVSSAMNFFGKGKKGRKSEQQQAEPPAIDFSSPDAFSEENMAKVGKGNQEL